MLGQFVSAIAGAAQAALAIVAVWVWVRLAGRSGRPGSQHQQVRAGAGDAGARWAFTDRPVMSLRWGLGAGIAAGAVLAFVRETTTVLNGEIVALATLGPMVAAEVALAIWALARPGRAPKGIAYLASAVVALGSLRATASVLANLGRLRDPGLAMVSTDGVLHIAGFLLGVGLVVLTAAVLARSAISATPRAAAGVLAVAVAVAATTHLVTIAQYLLARRVITVPRWGFRLIVWAINHEGLALYVLLAALFALPVAARAAARGAARTASLAASAALAGDGGGPAAAAPGTNDSDMVRAGQVDAGGLAVAAAAPAPDQCDCGNCGTDAVAVTAPAPDVPDPIPPAPGAVPRRSSSGRPNLRSGRPASAPNPAERRLARAANRSRVRFARATLGAYVGIVLAATLGAAIDSQEPELSPPEEFEIVDGRAVIPLDRLEDGHLHRFAFTASDGTEVRFIVIKKNGVAYGVGLDACEICGATGYYEKAGKIICRLCDVVMNIATIGFKGGCNPIPLDHTVEDGTLSVALADLESSAEVFA